VLHLANECPTVLREKLGGLAKRFIVNPASFKLFPHVGSQRVSNESIERRIIYHCFSLVIVMAYRLKEKNLCGRHDWKQKTRYHYF
jgi:hypothetical protein